MRWFCAVILAMSYMAGVLTTASAQSLVINEFMARNDGAVQDPAGDYDDWIEIYNSSPEAVDIVGMYLTDRLSNPAKWRVPDDASALTTIPAQGHLIVWADAATGEAGLHAGFKLDDQGEAIGLYDATGTLIDSITYGPQLPDRSYGRFPDGGEAWQTFNLPTPGQANIQDHADVIVSEIMYHPYSDDFTAEDTRAEFIELFNRGRTPVSLRNWQITDAVEFTFPDVVLDAGAYLVVAADPDVFAGLYPDTKNVTGEWNGRLGNAGETVVLRDDTGEVVDSVRYADNGDWSVRELGPVDYGHRGWTWRDDHDGGGKSLELICTALSNDYGANWSASDPNGGTPGWANSVATAEAAPLIAEVSHVPVIPGPIDPVTVTARVAGRANESFEVLLHYRVDHSEFSDLDSYPTFDANDYSIVTMVDDGAHGDALARDGLYGADIPAHPDGTVIEFFIEASDATGNSRTWPAPSLVDGEPRQVTNALYRVDAEFNPYTYWEIGGQPLYYFVMTEAERARLAYLGDVREQAFSHAQMNGTFISVDGQDILVRYNVGIRNRGNGSRTPPPNNYHVNFPKDRLWKGVSAININSKYTYTQLLGHAVFQMAGLPALKATRVQVRVNGENLAPLDPEHMYGSYVHLEVYDGDWAANHYPDNGDGNLYRCVSRSRHCDLRYRGDDPTTYGQTDWYGKQTNTAEADWSDLIGLTYALDESSDETYVEDVEKVVNVDEWMRWFALMALMTNRETNLSIGYGDDYCMYRGSADERFLLLPYDLDSVLTSSDPSTSIWLAGRLSNLPVIERFLTDPEFVPRYYAQLKDLAQTVMAPEQFNPLIEQVLGDWVPQQRIEAIQDFVAARRQYVLSVIPETFAVSSDLSTEQGYYATNIPYAFDRDVQGTASAIETRSVLVGGQLAQWLPRTGQWSLRTTMLDLLPGINRLTVETFDGPEGTGRKLDQGYADIYYQTDSTNDYPKVDTADGLVPELQADTTWTAAEGPYRITENMIVPAGVTLTVEPGTTIFFDPQVNLTVRGRLVAEGTPYQLIRFTRTPELADAWNGLQFVDTMQDNRISYAVVEYGQTTDGMIGLEASRLLLDHVTLDHAEQRRIRTIDSSLVVRHCHFTDVAPPGEPPATDNFSEHIWGSGVPEDGQFIIEDNVFGWTAGHNDAIDFDGARRPGPIPQILNNVFTGGGDDALDLETDAHIEGNVFMGYIKDRFNTAPRESNAISAGAGRDYVVVRNVFYHLQHVAQIKGQAFMHFENNTVVDANAPAFFFGLSDTDTPGRGAWIDSCVFWECPDLLDSYTVDDPQWGTTDITIDRCLVPTEWHIWGQGNIDADPLFEGPQDFHLQASSAARGAGTGGLDMGAYVSKGAHVAGTPTEWSHRTEATLSVWGPGITAYKYSLNAPEGPWSEQRSIDEPITLTGLRDGDSYTVYVLGKDSAGVWQAHPNASRTWTVNTAARRLQLSEVLAVNETTYEHGGAFPDMVELYYDGPETISLAGMSLTDDLGQPDRFVFPAGVTMSPGDYLVLWADSDGEPADLHLGFGLDAEGDELYLYGRDGALLDSVRFGPQLPDLSIGRTGTDGDWRLTVPTLGWANEAQPLGDPARVKINEWLAGTAVLFVHDFIELYNPGDWPVDLGGFRLTDNPTSQPGKNVVRPLSFASAQGYAVLQASNDEGPDRVNFGLSTDGEMIGLFDPNGREVDRVLFGPQTPDVSEGCAPDGSIPYQWFMLPTPRMANPFVAQPASQQITLVSEAADKRIIVPLSADHVDQTWKSDPWFDDSVWIAGSGAPGGIGYERGTGYEDLIGLDVTDLMYQINTSCYIRIPFTMEGLAIENLSELQLSLRYDDGYVAYLNGQEVGRGNFSDVPQWDAVADGSHEATGAAFDVVLDLTPYIGLLHEGRNLLAIQGLNRSTTSSDFLISVALEGGWVETVGTEHPYLKELQLLDGLRVTELMYHAPQGDAADYLELENIGDVPLDLTGLRFTDGVTFVFPSLTLEPGAFTVVVDDLDEFRTVYGADIPVAGEYGDRLSNSGEDVVLKLPAPWDAAVMRFRYADDWYPATDGDGQCLIVEDLTAAPVTWNDPANWGSADPAPGRP